MGILFIPLLIVLFAIVGIFFLFNLYWMIGGLFLISSIIINWISETLPLRIKGCREKHSYHKSFRVLNYNINNCHYFEENSETQISAFLTFIKLHRIDILCLQEVADIDSCGLDKALKLEFPYSSDCYDIYSRFPIDNHRQLYEDQCGNSEFQQLVGSHWEEMPIYSMYLNVDGIKVRLIDCYMMSNNFNRVKYDLASLSPWKRIVKTPFSILRYLLFGYKARSIGARLIAKELDNVDIPTIITGDFNDLSGSETLNIIQKKGFLDAWWSAGCGFGFTFCAQSMRWRLDHLLYSHNFTIRSIEVFDTPFSDHKPLVTSLSINSN